MRELLDLSEDNVVTVAKLRTLLANGPSMYGAKLGVPCRGAEAMVEV